MTRRWLHASRRTLHKSASTFPASAPFSTPSLSTLRGSLQVRVLNLNSLYLFAHYLVLPN